MPKALGLRRIVVVTGAAMLLILAAACTREIEVPGETVVVEKEVVKTVEVPGETVVVEKEVVKTVEVPGETVTKEIVKTVEVPGETVTKEVVRTVEVPGETVVVEKEVVKTVEVPGETIIVEKQVVKTVEVPIEKIVEKIVTKQIEVRPPGSVTPTGTVRVAWGEVSFPAMVPHRSGMVSAQMQAWTGAYEAPLYQNSDGFVVPRLAEAWEVSSDLMTYTFKVREGVPFHGDWGNMTASDWVWTGNDGWYGPNTNRTGVFVCTRVECTPTAVDSHIVKFTIKRPDPLFFFNMFKSHAGLPVGSQNRFNNLGVDDAMAELPDGGTGPFIIRDWIPDTEIITEAVVDHWRKTPNINEVRHLQITEIATVIAGLQAGDLDVAKVADSFIPELESAGLQTRSLGEGMFMGQWAGNFCIPEFEGKPVPARPAYDPNLPWIGDCDDMDSREDARKVRRALSMLIDRQRLVDGLVGGRGRPLFFWDGNGSVQDEFQRRTGTEGRWDVPYDPAMAQQFLSEAGWGDGFEFEHVCRTGGHPLAVESCEAVAALWEGADLGLKPTISRQPYRGGIRDRLVAREFQGIWFQGGGAGAPTFYNPLGDAARRPDAAFNPGSEWQETLDWFEGISTATTLQEFDKIMVEAADWISHWSYGFGVYGFQDVFAVNPDVVGEWPRSSNITIFVDFENIEHPE